MSRPDVSFYLAHFTSTKFPTGYKDVDNPTNIYKHQKLSLIVISIFLMMSILIEIFWLQTEILVLIGFILCFSLRSCLDTTEKYLIEVDYACPYRILLWEGIISSILFAILTIVPPLAPPSILAKIIPFIGLILLNACTSNDFKKFFLGLIDNAFLFDLTSLLYTLTNPLQLATVSIHPTLPQLHLIASSEKSIRI